MFKIGDDGEIEGLPPLEKPKRGESRRRRLLRAAAIFALVAIPTIVITLAGLAGILIVTGTLKLNRATPTPSATFPPTAAPTASADMACIARLGSPKLLFYAAIGRLGDQINLDKHGFYETDPQGSDACLLLNIAPAIVMRWSPDRRHIAFGVQTSNYELSSFDLYIMNSDGSNVQHTPYSWLVEWPPQWLPDGNSLLFADRAPNADKPNIILIDVESGKIKTLARGQMPSLSPDGQHIAFIQRSATQVAYFVMNNDGSHIQFLGMGDSRIGRPDWSPDSQRILILTARHWIVVKVDGSDPRPLPYSNFMDNAVQWALAGQRLGVVRTERTPRLSGEIWIDILNFKTATTYSVKLAESKPIRSIHFLVSNDDQHVYFYVVSDQPAFDIGGIYMVDANGTNLRHLTTQPVDDLSPARDQPRITLDNNYLTFSYDGALWLMNPDGSGLHKLPNKTGLFIFAFAWEPPMENNHDR